MSRGSVERRPSANATFRCPAAPGALTPVRRSSVAKLTRAEICATASPVTAVGCRQERHCQPCHKGCCVVGMAVTWVSR